MTECRILCDTRTVIKTFRHKGLSEVFEKGGSRRIAPDLKIRIQRRLDVLKETTKLEELNIPGFDFHQLRGRRKNDPVHYSIHVNGPWCITFEWDEKAGEATNVDLVQYHG